MGRHGRKREIMSILARNRTLSKLEFYAHAKRMRKQLLFLLTRDFGIKPRAREPTFYTKGWAAEDIELFETVCKKYGVKSVIGEYPLWIIQMFRGNVTQNLFRMMLHITRAYTIWATTKAEADLRRSSQDLAIADCESLKQELELAVDMLPVKAEKLIPYVDSIDREIALLKGWRKSDNKRFKDLK